MALVLLPLAAGAETVVVQGQAGSDGASGAAGEPGGDGGDGASATARADAPGEDNVAQAEGGEGGAGGSGDPTGAGGRGGDATAEAIASGAVRSEATATAGRGGAGEPRGAGGDATATATLDTDSAAAVSGAGQAYGGSGGGAAVSRVHVTNAGTGAVWIGGAEPGSLARGGFGAAGELAGSALAEAEGTGAGDVHVASEALGGVASSSGTTGGATAIAAGTASGDGDVFAEALADATAGWPPSELHGTARAEARATAAGDGDATAFATADGGALTAEAVAISEGAGAVDADATAGLFTLGYAEPGERSASAFGSNAGAAPVDVRAGVLLTRAEDTAALSAEGHSTGGGDVSVLAELKALVAGANVVELIDAVSGSTSGRLELEQRLNDRGQGSFPAEDIAVTSLEASNPGGGDLGIAIYIAGGTFGEAFVGDVVGTSTSGSDVDIDVTAYGGQVHLENRGLGGVGGLGPPSRLYGESNGGDVSVTLRAEHARDLNGVDGRAIVLENAVDGSTTGALSLAQSAEGGAGQGAGVFDSRAGNGGDARSVLQRSDAVASLTLASRARGGSAGIPDDVSQSRTGGSAEAIVDATNSAGSVFVQAEARAGSARGSEQAGSDAMVQATATTSGDGHAVRIGEPLPGGAPLAVHVAQGGAAGGGGTSGTLARGGDASSVSRGVAEGDSTVVVFDAAVGGAGGPGSGTAQSGDGGDATSLAEAMGGGVSAVAAKSEARGGATGFGTEIAGRGGNADAQALASGLGHVEAWALAIGGVSGPEPGGRRAALGVGGSGHARATADGASGFARAEALSGAGALPQVRALSEAAVGSRSDTAATAANGGALSDASAIPGVEGLAFLSGQPLDGDVAAARAGNAALDALFQSDPAAQMPALGRLGAWGRGEGASPLALTNALEIELPKAADPLRLYLAVFAIDLGGDDFESLSFSLERNGQALGDAVTFFSEQALRDFFSDALFDLGVFAGGDAVLARFDVALGGATSLSLDLAFAQVPEPGTGALVALGLALLACRSRRSSC